MLSIGAKFAERLIERRNLSPPIDVEGLAREYADLSYDALPRNVSGLALWLKHPTRRPEIVVNEDMSEGRVRFTIAHELGHVIIPWHVGNIIDEPLENLFGEDRSNIEFEADAFAGELLCPTPFVKRTIKRAANLAAAQREIESIAAVSGRAAAYRLVEVSNAALVAETRFNSDAVTWSMMSGDVRVTRPRPTSALRNVRFDTAEEASSCTIRASTYYWWQFAQTAKLSTSSGDWREIEKRLLDQYEPDRREKLRRSLSGIVGAANNYARSGNSGRVLEVLLERFEDRDELDLIVRHSEFRDYLSLRAVAMAKRWRENH